MAKRTKLDIKREGHLTVPSRLEGKVKNVKIKNAKKRRIKL